MMLTRHLKSCRSILHCAPLLLVALFCSSVLAQDKFPPPGQPQAAMPANAPRVMPQQNSANAFPSQQGGQQNPGRPAGMANQPMTGAGPRGGFQMPSTPAQAPGRSQQAQRELHDFGVPPTAQLHAGAMHGPTPIKIPGGRVTTTDELSAALRKDQQAVLLFHVLGGRETLPNAQFAAPASAAGTFNDETQQRFSQYLGQVTQGQKNKPLVFYCASLQCWMSYNAALRAINSGYSNVLWYRGGIEAWKAAGLPTSMQ